MAITAAFLLTACAGHYNELEWPYFQSSLGQNLETDFNSWARVEAVWPDARVTPPEHSVPPDLLRLSGKWSGWYCGGRSTDLKMVTETVTATEATISMSFAGYVQGGVVHFSVHPIDSDQFLGEYSGPTDPRAAVLFRLRSVNGVDVLDFKRTRLESYGMYGSAGGWCSGVLKKVSAN